MKPSERRQPANPKTRRKAFIRLGLAVGVLGTVLLVAWRTGALDLETIRRLTAQGREWSDEPWFVPLFVLAYAALVTVGLPASPVLIAGGVIFGLFPGALYNWMGSTLGAIGGYATGRLIGGGVVSAMFARKLKWIDSLRGENGFLTLLRLRLTLVIPYNLLNIASGMIRLPFRRYALAAAIGVIPSTTLYTAFAERLLSGAEGSDRNAFWHAAAIAGALLALSFVPRLFGRGSAPEPEVAKNQA